MHWQKLSNDILLLDFQSLPWLIFFDTTCVWHMGNITEEIKTGSLSEYKLSFPNHTIIIYGSPHEGAIHLPNGSDLEIFGQAFTSLDEKEEFPFVVVALIDVWRKLPQLAQAPDLAGRFKGVVCHELVHTLQLVSVAKKINELKTKWDLPDYLHDDIIEEKYKGDSVFLSIYQKELQMFYEAANEQEPILRDSLISNALSMVRNRKSRFYTNGNRIYDQIEDLFLNMEGVAVWVSYQIDSGHTSKPPPPSYNSWSQDTGKILFHLINIIVPDWIPQVLGPSLASPYDLLESSIK
ncbi:hypothetical protein ACFLSI_05890 [Bacteroidota bacterium]